MVRTAGTTRGALSVVVEFASGRRLLLVGEAAQVEENLFPELVLPDVRWLASPSQALSSLERLRELAADLPDPQGLLVSHDPARLRSWRLPPEFYD